MLSGIREADVEEKLEKCTRSQRNELRNAEESGIGESNGEKLKM
jgi:hypothetical protein